MQEFTVQTVSERVMKDLQGRSSGADCWIVDYLTGTGEKTRHVFPKTTMEWRAAEYGFGVSDVDELLDIVLHEPHIPDIADPDDAAARIGLVTSRARDAEPITLYNAANTDDARAALRARIADAKQSWARVKSTPGKGQTDPLDVIRAAHGITPDSLRAKREAVDIHRWQLRYGTLPVPLSATPKPLEARRA